jgi:ketosteroid isomerase-like protein
MTPEQVVRELYEAWGRGQPLPAELIAEDIEYVNPPDAVEGGTKHGPAMFDKVREVYDDVRLTGERFVPAGDEDVVVITRLTGVARASGLPIETLQGYIFTVRDGKAVRFRWFRTPAEALEAAQRL